MSSSTIFGVANLYLSIACCLLRRYDYQRLTARQAIDWERSCVDARKLPCKPQAGQAELTHEFSNRKYVVIRQAVPRELCQFIYRYIQLKRDNAFLTRGDNEIPESWCAYADPAIETLLEHLQPTVESATGLSLIPTYSYVRIYLAGATLKPHTDRPSCEIGVSLTLGRTTECPWPLFVSSDMQQDVNCEGSESISGTPIELDPGDLIIFRGMDVLHWRESLVGNEQTQALMHYVDKNGKFTHLAYDGRPGLAFIPGVHVDARPKNDAKTQ